LSVTWGRSVILSGYFGFLHEYNWPPWNIVESGADTGKTLNKDKQTNKTKNTTQKTIIFRFHFQCLNQYEFLFFRHSVFVLNCLFFRSLEVERPCTCVLDVSNFHLFLRCFSWDCSNSVVYISSIYHFWAWLMILKNENTITSW